MKQLQYFISMFTKITTGTLLICALIVTLNGLETWTTMVLWQIPAIALAATAVTMLALPDREFTRRVLIIRYIIHYVLITVVILLAGYWFGWYEITPIGCISMMASIAAVYGFTYFTNWLSGKRSAEELNKALQDRRNLRK